MDFLLNFMNVASIRLKENCQTIKYRSLWEDYLVVCPHTALATAIAAACEHDGEIHLGVKFGRILLMPI